MAINDILGKSAFWLVNKKIAKFFKSNDTAILLSDLITKQEFFKQKGELTEEGFFFNTSDNIQEDCNISYHKQKKHLTALEKAGFIESKLMGVPARLHFKVVENKILNFLKTGIEEIQKLEFEKFEYINNNKEIKIKNNNKRGKTSFTPPSLSDIKDYFDFKANEKGVSLNSELEAEKFLNFYESKGWYVGKSKMKNYKSSITNWINRIIEKQNERNNGTIKKDSSRSQAHRNAENINYNKFF